MADLIGEEMIDWDTFGVTDPNAPEYQGPTVPVAEVTAVPAEGGHDGQVEQTPAPEDTALEQDGRPRDPDTGQFLSAEEAERRQAEQAEQERLWAGKYRTPEELERAWHEREQLLGRQGNELGELRRQMADLAEALKRPPAPQLGDIDSLFAENPAKAAERAIAAQDAQAYDRVLREWSEIDPAQAEMYQTMKQVEYRSWQAQQQIEQLSSEQETARYGSAMETAWQRLQAEIPDLDQLAAAMQEEAVEAARVAGGEPVYSKLLQSGDPEQVYYAFRTLALTARSRNGAAQHQHAADLARTAAVESQRAKAEAIVASSTSTAPEAQAPKSYDEQLLETFQQDDARRDGFQVGNY